MLLDHEPTTNGQRHPPATCAIVTHTESCCATANCCNSSREIHRCEDTCARFWYCILPWIAIWIAIHRCRYSRYTMPGMVPVHGIHAATGTRYSCSHQCNTIGMAATKGIAIWGMWVTWYGIAIPVCHTYSSTRVLEYRYIAIAASMLPGSMLLQYCQYCNSSIMLPVQDNSMLVS